jgi:chemotaxis protein CheZ
MHDAMAPGADPAAWRGRAELRIPPTAVDEAMVTEVVRVVLATMRGDLTAQEASLLAEVEDLGRTIACAKAEIAALRVSDITADDIPLATDELDAIVAHTAAATESILETCETLDGVGSRLARGGAPSDAAEASAQLQEATTRIYEACSFQDITGQRIGKVVAALKLIDVKVARMVATFGAPRVGVGGPPLAELATIDAALLNGPQLPGAAMAQTDIDKLLASFD